MLGNNFKGTGRLIRLALRRDRIKLPLWILIILAMTAGSVPALSEFYGSTEQQVEYAVASAPSVIARAFGGPVQGASLGSIAMVELFVFTAILIAFMSTLAIIRHTRHNEELGASELIGSAVVGRYAQLAAALSLVIGLNILLGLLLFASLAGSGDLPVSGVLGMTAAWTLIGILFAGIASVAAQVAESARGANGIAGGSIGAFFLIRAVGDAFGSANPDGLSATSSWLTWFSPFGWGTLMQPFSQPRWWLLGLLALTALLLIYAASLILARRDVGSGLIATRPGRPFAKTWLLSPLGLAWRLQRGVLYGWWVGYIVFGLLSGFMAIEFGSLIADNEAFQEYLGNIGGDVTDMFFSTMFNMGAIIAAGYTLQALLRLRSEESSGYVESLLATATGRIKWLLSHVLVAVMGTVLLMTTFGFLAGLSYMFAGDASASDVLRLTASTMVQIPALLAFGSFMLLLFGLLPNLVTALTWGAFILSLLISQLAVLLKLPQLVINLSPFSHVPLAPSSTISLTPLIWLLGVSLVLATIGVIGFTRRDISLS